MKTATRHLGLMVSTETRGGQIATAVVKGLIFLQIAAVLFIVLWTTTVLGDLGSIAAALIAVMLAGGLSTFVAWPLAVRLQGHGLWRIDATGIDWHPVHGRSRSMRWIDVRRVRWGRARITLYGQGGPIRVGSDLLSLEEHTSLVAAVRHALDGYIPCPENMTADARPQRSPRVLTIMLHVNVTLPLVLATWVAAAGSPWLLPLAAMIYVLRLATSITIRWRTPVTTRLDVTNEEPPAPSDDDAGGDGVESTDETPTEVEVAQSS